jgi:hypothetical protein
MGSQSEPLGQGWYDLAMQPLETVLIARMGESDHLLLSFVARDSNQTILPGPVYVQANERASLEHKSWLTGWTHSSGRELWGLPTLTRTFTKLRPFYDSILQSGAEWHERTSFYEP